jgi:thiamine pyrophosphokinase
MRSIIFANGDFSQDKDHLNLTENDLIIAVDGGSRHCQDLEIIPNVLIGDLDSVTETLLKEWESSGVKVISFPTDKDQTDLELALLYAQTQNPDEILVYGGVGGRLDMTFGNLMLLNHPELVTKTTFIRGSEKVYLLKAGDTLTLEGAFGDIVSLISLSFGQTQITTQGLEFALSEENLPFGYSRGISNRMISDRAEIQLGDGLLIIFHTRE